MGPARLFFLVTLEDALRLTVALELRQGLLQAAQGGVIQGAAGP